MKLCPNCGQEIGAEDLRFCSHCGYQLPRDPAGAAAGASAPPQSSTPPYQPSAQPYQQAQQADPSATYTAQTYTQQAPNGYAPPSYLSGANLPASRPQQTTPPAIPSSLADFSNLARAARRRDTNSMVRMALIALVAIVAIVIVVKVVSWLLSILLPILIVAAIVFGAWWYLQRGRRGRRLP